MKKNNCFAAKPRRETRDGRYCKIQGKREEEWGRGIEKGEDWGRGIEKGE